MVDALGFFSYCWTARRPESAIARYWIKSGQRYHSEEISTLSTVTLIFGRPASRQETKRHSNAKMVPDTEVVCQTSEASVDSGDNMFEQIKDRPENEVTSMTAWKRYQQLVSMLEFNDREFNQKSMIEEIFRGTDLIYASH